MTVAITIWQPWATLIALGHKDIENRTWPIRHRGALLVHAGVRVDPRGHDLAQQLGIVLPDELPSGGIVGQVDIVGCVRDSPSAWAAVGHWHWLLANARELPFQPMRGQRGVFHVGDQPEQPSLFSEQDDRPENQPRYDNQRRDTPR